LVAQLKQARVPVANVPGHLAAYSFGPGVFLALAFTLDLGPDHALQMPSLQLCHSMAFSRQPWPATVNFRSVSICIRFPGDESNPTDHRTALMRPLNGSPTVSNEHPHEGWPYQIGVTLLRWYTTTETRATCSRRSARKHPDAKKKDTVLAALGVMIEQSQTGAVATRKLYAIAMNQRGSEA
jgi:hypothetical protein